MRLKIRHLEVFEALLDAGSVSQAAQRLNLSQPAVSVALANFEADLGFRLFHRNRGYFAPTKEALLLQEEVRQSLTSLSRITQSAREIRSGAVGVVSIATNGAMAYNLLPSIVADFQKEWPDVNIEIRVHSSRRVAAWVASGQIDIGIMDAPVPAAGLKADLFEMECVCIMPKSHPLAMRDVVTPKDLSGERIIGVTGDHMVDRQLDAVMSQIQSPVSRNTNSYFFAIARQIVAAGHGISIVDPVNGNIKGNDGVISRPFHPEIIYKIAMVRNRSRPLDIVAYKLYENIKRALS